MEWDGAMAWRHGILRWSSTFKLNQYGAVQSHGATPQTNLSYWDVPVHKNHPAILVPPWLWKAPCVIFWIPSGKHTIVKMAIEIVDLSIKKWWFSLVMLNQSHDFLFQKRHVKRQLFCQAALLPPELSGWRAAHRWSPEPIQKRPRSVLRKREVMIL